MPEQKRMTTRLKELFDRPEIFVLPGGMNPIGAKMAEVLGFGAFYSPGATPRPMFWVGLKAEPVCGTWWVMPDAS